MTPHEILQDAFKKFHEGIAWKEFKKMFLVEDAPCMPANPGQKFHYVTSPEYFKIIELMCELRCKQQDFVFRVYSMTYSTFKEIQEKPSLRGTYFELEEAEESILQAKYFDDSPCGFFQHVFIAKVVRSSKMKIVSWFELEEAKEHKYIKIEEPKWFKSMIKNLKGGI